MKDRDRASAAVVAPGRARATRPAGEPREPAEPEGPTPTPHRDATAPAGRDGAAAVARARGNGLVTVSTGDGDVAVVAPSSPGAAVAAHADAAADAAGPATPPGPADPDAPLRVVVADDADGVRELLCLVLDLEPDFTVVGRASNGAEAVDLVTRTRPDLVLLDVAMPVLDGIAALPRVRRAVPGARVVIFTGFSAYTVREEALGLGADDVLEKGLGTPLLVDRLRALCCRPAAG